MRIPLNYSDVFAVWLDEDENNKFEPEPCRAYCIHYKDADGEDKTANLFFDLLSKYDGIDSCESCPFSRDARPSGEPPCKYMICDGLLPRTFDFAADNTTLLFDDYEYVVVDADELEEKIREDAAKRLNDLRFKLAGCYSPKEIDHEYKFWLDFTPGYLRDVLERDGLALKAVEQRKETLGEPAKKKRGRPRKAKGKKKENAEPTIAPAPVPTTAPLVGVPATDPPPILYAPVESPDDRKSEERRKKWEDALLELDKEAREWEIKAALAKINAKEASNVAKPIREKIQKLLSDGSEKYVDETPLFNGIDDAPESEFDANQQKGTAA